MSGISKRVSGSWVSGDYGIMKTATDTITTLPAVIYANGTTATVGLKGNTVQSTTPTPQNPVMPNGTGERTGNLFDIDNTIENYYLRNGVPTEYNIGRYVLSDYIPIESDTATICAKVTVISPTGAHWAVYDENKTFIRGGLAFDAQRGGNKTKLVDTSGATFIRVDYASESFTDCRLNLGSTALPYEPYGIKIPISSASATTPVYLGEVETTRKIRKLVLTGEEEWQTYTQIPNTYRSSTNNSQSIGNPAICSHFVNSSISTISSGKFTVGSTWIYFRYEDVTDLADFKSYLAAQYAAETPVTVWYVLATEETGIINEPLMKIGDYADTLSNVSIPVTAGGDTLSVNTTVQPSEVTVNYKGWHPVADVHERESSQWD